jgi:hypothetical protein
MKRNTPYVNPNMKHVSLHFCCKITSTQKVLKFMIQTLTETNGPSLPILQEGAQQLL